jgi:hypothetical protein
MSNVLWAEFCSWEIEWSMGVVFGCVLRAGGDVRVDGRRELIGIVWALSLALSPLHLHRYERYPFFNEIHMLVSANCNSKQHTRR